MSYDQGQLEGCWYRRQEVPAAPGPRTTLEATEGMEGAPGALQNHHHPRNIYSLFTSGIPCPAVSSPMPPKSLSSLRRAGALHMTVSSQGDKGRCGVQPSSFCTAWVSKQHGKRGHSMPGKQLGAEQRLIPVSATACLAGDGGQVDGVESASGTPLRFVP